MNLSQPIDQYTSVNTADARLVLHERGTHHVVALLLQLAVVDVHVCAVLATHAGVFRAVDGCLWDKWY